MKTIFALLGLALVAGLAAAAYLITESTPQAAPPPTPDAGLYFDQSAALEERIRALEQAVAEERNARQLLEEELQALYAEIDGLGSQDGAPGIAGEDAVAVSRQVGATAGRVRPERGLAERRLDALVEGGFSPDRAEWITQRETELRFEAMQASFEARRSGEPLSAFDPAADPGLALRNEIGDAEYERYLQAIGRSTSVAVNSVLESSPGAVAGLQAGDRIVGYDGHRVFNTRELNLQTMQGEPGSSVVVDILRDGTPMQVVLPRGPIGIYTREGRRGR